MMVVIYARVNRPSVNTMTPAHKGDGDGDDDGFPTLPTDWRTVARPATTPANTHARHDICPQTAPTHDPFLRYRNAIDDVRRASGRGKLIQPDSARPS